MKLMSAILRRSPRRSNNWDRDDVTLAKIAEQVEQNKGGEPIDRQWLQRVSGLLATLKKLKWKYEQGTTGRGRASMGMLNSTGCSSVWGSTFPFNPYPFPWANHLFQDRCVDGDGRL